MEESKKVYGIDLGTTYSCIATIDEYGQAIVLKNSLGNSVTPSVVYYENEKKVVVGETAKDEVDASRRVSFIKREMGNDHFVSSCVFPEDPTTVSAYIIGQLVKDANDATMQEIKDVVITCPAYFGAKERLQTKEAGCIAGLNVLSIINEPTAAAISYGLNSKEEKTVLVYDLGGGTFDVTLIEVTNSKIRVVATGGDSRLGGADWDNELVKHLATQFENETGMSDISSDPDTQLSLYIQAEKVKKQLSSREVAKTTVMHDGTTAKIEVTRETFEALTSDLLGRTITITDDVLKAAKEKDPKYARFDEVLLVGGSSLMPQVKIAVDSKLNCNAKMFDPHESVAKGAAIFAMYEKEFTIEEDLDKELSQGTDFVTGGDTAILGVGGSKKKEIVNVLSKSYGIGSVIEEGNKREKVISNLLFEQDEVPTSVNKTFMSVDEGQSEMLLELFESSTTRADSVQFEGKEYKGVIARKLGGDPICSVTIDFGGEFPKGYKVSVMVTLDAEGVIVVSAKDNRTGKEISVEAVIRGIRSKEEVKKAAAKFAAMVIES